MRRLLPWVLVALVGVGAALGAALGQVNAPGTTDASASPAEWVAGVLAATKAAGTAQLRFTEVTQSSNPDLRGSTAGSGAVDFTAGTFRVSDVAHQLDWSISPTGAIQPHPETFGQGEVAIGRAVYQKFGISGPLDEWTKESFPRNEGALGLGSAGGFVDALSSLTAPYSVLSVRALGTVRIDGTATTRYLVESALRVHCKTTRALAKEPAQPLLRTTLWLDSQGRLVQARSALYSSGRIPASDVKADPALAHRPMGSTISTTTLRLTGFGLPVHVSAPAVNSIGTSYSSASIVLRSCA